MSAAHPPGDRQHRDADGTAAEITAAADAGSCHRGCYAAVPPMRQRGLQ